MSAQSLSMNRTAVLTTIGIIGVFLGIAASQMYAPDESYCEKLQKDIRDKQNFSGSVTCYPPGTVEVNLSESIENRTDLECVCKKVDESGVSLFPITTAGN